MIPESYITRLRMMLPELEHRLSEWTVPAVRFNPPSGTSSPESPVKSQNDIKYSDLPDPDLLENALQDLIDRLSRHYPFHHSCYAGQMLKPPHPAAWLSYSIAMTINPNNHALDGGPESSLMEKEVVQELLRFAGFPKEGTGHLTSSGTIANLEALWIARELHPGRPVAITSNAHYTHSRMCRLLNHPFLVIPNGADGLPDPELLDPAGPLPGTVVVTLGTTGMGTVEPLHHIARWAKRNGVRIHVDAAYGGFFQLLRDSGWIDPAPWKALSDSDSIVIDPHKHGLQPYGCGSVLFRDAAVHSIYQHDSPYTYFTSDEMHLGEISLECSRAGSAAIALWFTLKVLPLEMVAKTGAGQVMVAKGSPSPGECGTGLGQSLLMCRMAAMQLYEELLKSDFYHPIHKPDLDIVTFLPVTKEKTYSAVGRRSEIILKQGMAPGSEHPLFLSTLKLSADQAQQLLPDYKADREHVTVLRSVLMKPDHLEFLPEMLRRLDALYRHTDGCTHSNLS